MNADCTCVKREL